MRGRALLHSPGLFSASSTHITEPIPEERTVRAFAPCPPLSQVVSLGFFDTKTHQAPKQAPNLVLFARAEFIWVLCLRFPFCDVLLTRLAKKLDPRWLSRCVVLHSCCKTCLFLLDSPPNNPSPLKPRIPSLYSRCSLSICTNLGYQRFVH